MFNLIINSIYCNNTKKSSNNNKDVHKKIIKDFFKFKTIKCNSQTNNLTTKTITNNNLKIEKILKNNEKFNNIKVHSSGSDNGWCLITDTYLQYGFGFLSSPNKYEHNDEIFIFILNKVFDYHLLKKLFSIEYNKNTMILNHKTTNYKITIHFTNDHKISNIIIKNLINNNKETVEITLTDIIYK